MANLAIFFCNWFSQGYFARTPMRSNVPLNELCHGYALIGVTRNGPCENCCFLSTVVGKYARRPLNHAARELSLRARARLIVLVAHIRAKKSNNTGRDKGRMF